MVSSVNESSDAVQFVYEWGETEKFVPRPVNVGFLNTEVTNLLTLFSTTTSKKLSLFSASGSNVNFILGCLLFK